MAMQRLATSSISISHVSATRIPARYKTDAERCRQELREAQVQLVKEEARASDLERALGVAEGRLSALGQKQAAAQSSGDALHEEVLSLKQARDGALEKQRRLEQRCSSLVGALWHRTLVQGACSDAAVLAAHAGV